MSISSIRTIATSSLTASQVQIQVAAANIANADTDGYTRKVASQTATVTGGVSSGTTVTAISSTVDKYLLADLVASVSDQSAADVAADYAESLATLFGTVSSSDDTGTSIADSLADFETALSSLAGTPESDILGNISLDSLTSLTAQLRETSAQIQGLRADADAQIEDAVSAVNTALETIDSLNDQIIAADSRGMSTAELEDLRNQALQELASYIDVSYYTASDGSMRIATASGTVLLDSSVHELSYDASSTVTADTVFSAITVDGADITDTLTGGTVGALIEQRDDILPAVQDELDTLAAGLIDALNAVYNSGTALPAPDSLTGTTAVDGTDSFSGTGTARIALVDDDGALVSYADFDLSSYATVDDLVAAIDATDGLDAAITNGVLTISSTDGSGVTLVDIDTEIGADGEGLSAYFGLNDLLTGTSASDIKVSSAVTETGLATATLSTADTLTVGETVASPSADFVQSLMDVLGTDQSFDAAGALGSTSTSFAEYAAEIVSDVSARATTAETVLETAQSAYDSLADAYSSETGVNIDEETARLTEYQQLYSASAQLYEVLNEMFDALMSAVG